MEPLDDNRLLRVLTALTCEPWLISPAAHGRLMDIAMAHAFGGNAEAAQHAAAEGMPANPAARNFRLDGSTAVIPVEGVIGRKFAGVLRSSGVVSIDIFDRILSSAAEDPEVKSILIVFDSPGGTAMQVESVGAHIAAVGKNKPVLAWADGLMCSAAYWMASQCNLVLAADYAHVGSIGVYLALLDSEAKGRVEMIHSGRFKGMGYPGTLLTQDQYDHLRSEVDRLGQNFRGAVRSGRPAIAGKRPAISDDVMQGQSFAVEAAVANGLIDGVSDYATALRHAAWLGEHNRRKE